jgi:hypothetical protein
MFPSIKIILQLTSSISNYIYLFPLISTITRCFHLFRLFPAFPVIITKNRQAAFTAKRVSGSAGISSVKYQPVMSLMNE